MKGDVWGWGLSSISLMPFWLKGRPGFLPFMALVVSGGDRLLALPSPVSPGIPFLLGGIVIGAFTLGVCTGWTSHRLWLWWGSFRASTQCLKRAAWARLVQKAVTFHRKRRGVALAFSNYKTHTLRNTEHSKPTTARRRRVLTPAPKGASRASSDVELTPLREGPVHHGPYRSRA